MRLPVPSAIVVVVVVERLNDSFCAIPLVEKKI